MTLSGFNNVKCITLMVYMYAIHLLYKFLFYGLLNNEKAHNLPLCFVFYH